jgi:xanthine dehydrogenase small subunit
VCRALAAHLCRCTGWNTIVDAAAAGSGTAAAPMVSDVAAASRRASLETGGHQRLGADVVLGRAPAGDGGFGADTAPGDALVALIGTDGEWVVGETLAEARRLAGRVQGRRTTVESRPPIDLPPGDWALTLQTSWVEPAYLETDASWCDPGGEPATPLANGGAFGGKLESPIPGVARRLADEHGRAVLVLWSREESVRLGPKRPPIAAGLGNDGSGIVRVARAPGIAAAIGAALPGVTVEEVDLAGPPTSAAVRAAGRAEAIALTVAAGVANAGVTFDGEAVRIDGSEGSVVTVRIDEDAIHVEVDAGDPLDVTALRSYCVGAAHMATSWVTSEALSIGADGEVGDLTIRSFDILRAVDTPPIVVTVTPSDRPPVRVSDDVFAAVAAAVWRRQGHPPVWPTRRRDGLPVRR